MYWEYNSFTLPLLVTAIISSTLGVFALRRRAIPGANGFIVLMSSVAMWSLTYALEMGSPTLPAKLFWSQVEYLGIVTVPVAWLIFSFQYTGLRRWLSIRKLVFLAIVPALTLLLVWTNHLHGLIWSSVFLNLVLVSYILFLSIDLNRNVVAPSVLPADSEIVPPADQDSIAGNVYSLVA
jgi:hypothetical protein